MSFSSSLDHLLAPGSARNELHAAPPEQIIGLLASGLRTRRAHVLAYIAGLLGSVAGPVASLKGYLGERHLIDLPLLLDATPSLETAIRALFLEPALRFCDLARLASQSAHAGQLRSYDEEFGNDRHEALRSELSRSLVAHTKKLIEPQVGEFEEIASAAGSRRLLSQIESPSLIVTAPAVGDFRRILCDVLDYRPLILDADGRVLEGALAAGKKGEAWRQFVEALERAQGMGTDIVIDKGSRDSPGIATRLKAPFIFHFPGERLGEALSEPSVSKLLSHALILRPKTTERAEMNVEMVKAAAKKVRQCLKEVILARRNGTGVVYEMRTPEPKLIERVDGYLDMLDRLEPSLRNHCSALRELPYALLWTVLVLSGNSLGQDDQGYLHLAVLKAAELLANEHIRNVKLALHEHRLRAQSKQMEDFFLKAASKVPCTPREVFRSYRDQRREVHGPVLEVLIRIGALRYRALDRKLEVVPEAGPPWDLGLIAKSSLS